MEFCNPQLCLSFVIFAISPRPQGLLHLEIGKVLAVALEHHGVVHVRLARILKLVTEQKSYHFGTKEQGPMSINNAHNYPTCLLCLGHIVKKCALLSLLCGTGQRTLIIKTAINYN